MIETRERPVRWPPILLPPPGVVSARVRFATPDEATLGDRVLTTRQAWWLAVQDPAGR